MTEIVKRTLFYTESSKDVKQFLIIYKIWTNFYKIRDFIKLDSLFNPLLYTSLKKLFHDRLKKGFIY